MAVSGATWGILKSISPMVFIHLLFALLFISAERGMNAATSVSEGSQGPFSNFLLKAANQTVYQRVWPELKFGWNIVIGTVIGFFGAAFGSVGGVGGGGIFVPMLLPQGTRTYIASWTFRSQCGGPELEYRLLPTGPGKIRREAKVVTVVENVCWMELGLLVFVWVAFLGIQIATNHTTTSSVAYWVLNLLQIPVAVSVSLYEAISLYKGRRVISSKGDQETHFRVHQLVFYCACGVLAGIVGGLLRLDGGFIMGPLFLELGVPPEVSRATATFSMVFSSSMSVMEYYLLKRFPIPYASYFVIVATIAALTGQHIVRKLISIFGRASMIVFILAFTIFVSAISLGGFGIVDMFGKIERHEHMGFENLCTSEG